MTTATATKATAKKKQKYRVLKSRDCNGWPTAVVLDAETGEEVSEYDIEAKSAESDIRAIRRDIAKYGVR